MKIYLIRHGIAEERGGHKPDEQRELTSKGKIKTEKIAQKLSDLTINFATILTSPLVRAKQTAAILAKAQLTQQIIEFAPLAPGGNIQDWFDWLQNSAQSNSEAIALVGHQPDLTNWAELLVWGKIGGKLSLKKAGLIGLEIGDLSNSLGTGELFLLISPKWLIEE